jgi:N-acetylglucosaminyldiphosphoundecaprenol N-acetyl-beta-D-mannosaminyltransferase
MSSAERIRLGPLPVDRITFTGAIEAIAAMIEEHRGGTVFTPNVDHVVLAATDAGLRGAYAAVDLSLADGVPVVLASRMLGTPVPEKISGSDLAPRLMAHAARRGWRVFLLGGAPGVAARAASRLTLEHPGLQIAGTAAPRIGPDDPDSHRAAVVERVLRSRPHVVLVGLGSPKQELWIHQAAAALRPAVLVGVGAAIDFAAGAARRAPPWLSRVGGEWLWRLAHEPRRLWRRYLVRDRAFLSILAAQLLDERVAPVFLPESRP